mgnify:CR=1 FL=1
MTVGNESAVLRQLSSQLGAFTHPAKRVASHPDLTLKA